MINNIQSLEPHGSSTAHNQLGVHHALELGFVSRPFTTTSLPFAPVSPDCDSLVTGGHWCMLYRQHHIPTWSSKHCTALHGISSHRTFRSRLSNTQNAWPHSTYQQRGHSARTDDSFRIPAFEDTHALLHREHSSTPTSSYR